MPRRRRLRRVVSPPGFKGYRPYGNRFKNHEAVELFYEEYESIKLADYDSMTHLEASEVMGVSRATFARIYAKARQKIAMALVESKEIKTVFGHAFFDNDWYICHDCNSKFTLPYPDKQSLCPMCNSENYQHLNDQQ